MKKLLLGMAALLAGCNNYDNGEVARKHTQFQDYNVETVILNYAPPLDEVKFGNKTTLTLRNSSKQALLGYTISGEDRDNSGDFEKGTIDYQNWGTDGCSWSDKENQLAKNYKSHEQKSS